MDNTRIEKLNRNIWVKTIYTVVLLIFAAYTLSIIATMLWSFLQSLKTNVEFWDDSVSLPKDWLFSNYPDAFAKIKYESTSFFGMFLNSFWFAGGSAVLGTFMHCITGYIFAKYKFRGKEIAFSFVLFTITIPVVGNMPSLYKIVMDMGINDSPLFLITQLGGFGPNFLIMYAFFKTVDSAYSEAAQIDGAGDFYIFIFIMMPIAVGPFIALSVLQFILMWNNYELAILFLSKMPPLAAGLFTFKEIAIYHSDESVYLAGILTSIVPVVLLVSIFGNMIMKNMTIGGVKG